MRVERREVVPNDRLHVAFRLPVDETDDFIAGAVALDCIGGLATSRLVRRLVRREQTALGAHATAWGFVDGASLGFVVLDVAPGTDPDRSWLSALASQEERADLVSHYLPFHDDPDVVNTHLDRLRDVTAEQVVESARRWLRPDSRATVAYLVADDASDAETATTEDVA